MRAVGRHGHARQTEIVRQPKTPNDDIVIVDGLRVTPILQTVFDCMRWMPFAEGLVVAVSTLRARLVEKDQLIDYILSRESGVRGVPQAYVCAIHADGRAENGGESLSRAIMLELGFACPEPRVEVPNPINPGHPYRLDFAWRLANGQLFGGEHDGLEKYTNDDMLAGRSALDALVTERQRESRISALGIKVLRFTARQRCNAEQMWGLLSAYGVPWVGVPEEISSPKAAARMLAKARRWRREERWIQDRLLDSYQMRLESRLVTIEVIQGSWRKHDSRDRVGRPQRSNAAASIHHTGTHSAGSL